jgi:hypothetical protein
VQPPARVSVGQRVDVCLNLIGNWATRWNIGGNEHRNTLFQWVNSTLSPYSQSVRACTIMISYAI